MLLEQFQAFWQRDTGIGREVLTNVEKASGVPHAIIISGLRRVGKSTPLAQLAHRLGALRAPLYGSGAEVLHHRFECFPSES